MAKSRTEEVGNLFVGKKHVLLKLMPSKKAGTRSINWFSAGRVANIRLAAKDIAFLVGKLQGQSMVVKRLTVATDHGTDADLRKMRLIEAVEKAGFSVLA